LYLLEVLGVAAAVLLPACEQQMYAARLPHRVVSNMSV
jgi:hypothetical protein